MRFISIVITAKARDHEECSNAGNQPDADREPQVNGAALNIYDAVDRAFDLYEACESLIDVEDNFQFWRFRHLRTVQRTIGFKTGTGGSSGVRFLQKALDLTFFPELYAVRTEIGR